MHAMYDMHDPNGSLVEWNYDRSSNCKMRVLYQPLADLNIGCLEIGTSDARASDVVPSVYDQAKEWRSWPDDDELLSVACSSLFLPPELFC